MIFRREGAQPIMRAELRGSQAELAILIFELHNIEPDGGEPITLLGNFKSHQQRGATDHDNRGNKHAGHEARAVVNRTFSLSRTHRGYRLNRPPFETSQSRASGTRIFDDLP